MTASIWPEETTRASVSKRELRNLARRLTPSERSELRTVARALDKIASGETYSRAHHVGSDYDPHRCAACVPSLMVVWAIGVAFPTADAEDLWLKFVGQLGLSLEDIRAALEAGRDEHHPPDVVHAWLALTDGHRDELDALRAELEPGWYQHAGHWHRDCDAPTARDPEVVALIAELRAIHYAVECKFVASQRVAAGHTAKLPNGRDGWLVTDAALIQEIRLGSDPRKARAAKRTLLKKGFDSSWLL